jgi:hypothetical protein
MDFAYKLLDVLTKSIEKNGDQPLTTQYLLNITRFCIKSINLEEQIMQQHLDEAETEIYRQECCDRD